MSGAEPFTDTGAALLRAICLAPEDDAPRLAYADWLDENGQDERAEFIRVEIERANTGLIRCVEPHKPALFGCGVCEFCKLEMKSEEYHCTQAIWREISAGLEETFGGYSHTSRHPSHGNGLRDPWTVVFTSRGFIDEVHCTLAVFMERAQAIALTHPVRKWVLTDRRSRRVPSGDHDWWCAAANVTIIDAEDLPRELYDFIPVDGGSQLVDHRYGWMSYDTPEEADAALQQACYYFARQRLTSSAR